MMRNHRHQHAVGQGFFHTAELEDNGRPRLRYVYDCGAMMKYATPRDARIDSYIKSVGSNHQIDILFLSHVHYDHVSGVTRLLASGAGLTVDTIVLPLLSIADRLICYARAIGEEPGIVGEEFYRALVVDPAAALSRFGPRQILFVRRGNPDAGAPGSGVPDDSSDAGWEKLEIYGQRREREITWKLIGSGRSERAAQVQQLNDGALATEQVAVIDDTLAFMMMSEPAAGGTSFAAEWLLAPFVDPTIEAKRHKFIKALAQSKSMTVPALKSWLEQVTNVQDLIVNGIPDLVAAYGAIEPDFNVTSLCLYSGPRPVATAPKQAHAARAGEWSLSFSATKRIAWLATGDAALASASRSSAFSKHYGRLLAEVVTFTLPHHGSDHNLNLSLIQSVGARLFVAAADQFAKWKHPGSRTVQAVAALGYFVSTVTSAPASEVEEVAEIS